MKRSGVIKSGFTLIEALVATALIGIAVAALLSSNVSHTQANAYSMNTSTAEFLIEEIKSMMMPLNFIDPNDITNSFGTEEDESALADYDDLDDFDGVTFNPPVDVSRNVLTDFPGYSQIVTVESVDPADFSVVNDYYSSVIRVSVSIEKNGEQISSASWIRTQR